MAETVGFAASVAGLIALAGQVLQGGLFIQQFFKDVRDAPADILDLRDELELFIFVVDDTKRLFEHASLAGIPLENGRTGYKRTLERCSQIVDEILQRLRCWIGAEVIDAGKRAWWARLKVASRKKALGEYLQRLERAKGQLLILQSNLMQAFLFVQHQASVETNHTILRTNEAINALSLITNEVHSQGIQVADSIQALDGPVARMPQDMQYARMVRAPPYTEVRGTGLVLDRGSPMARTEIDGELNLTHSSLEATDFRTRTCSSTQFDFWLVEIDLESRSWDQSLDEDQAPHNSTQNGFKNVSSFHARIRIPFLRRNWTFRLQNTSQGFDMQMQTYNILPRSSPIFEACLALDLPLIQELFRKGSASPFDVCRLDGESQISILDLVFSAFCDDEAGTAMYLQGVACIKYILTMYKDIYQMITPEYFQRACSIMLWEPEVDESFLDGMRLLLSQINESPFQFPSTQDIASWITLQRAKLPVASFLLQQQYHDIELEQRVFNVGTPFCENDRTMLFDLEGLNVRRHLLLGGEYKFCCEELNYEPLSRSTTHTTYALIFTAKHSANPKVILCCKNRLALLIRNEFHRGLCSISSAQSTQDRFFDSFARVSPLEYALRLGLSEFMHATLLEAGLDKSQVMDLFNEIEYAGIPGLLDGILTYMDQRTCRKMFILDLLHGKFVDADKDNDAIVREIAASTGVPLPDRWFVERLIEYASRAYRLKTTPGSWIEEEKIVLVPKVDFPAKYFICFQRYPEKQELVDIRDWLKFEDEA